MIPDRDATTTNRPTVLTDEQLNACEWLLALARVRASTTEAALPKSVLGRWTVPLLVGPAGSGKGYVCEEVARRLGNQPCRRWEIGSWIIVANRSSHTTLEQIQSFIESNASGCVVYLAGVDTFAAKAERNMGYFQAMVSEVAELLDRLSARSVCFAAQNGSTVHAKVLVVVGGCFAALWGDAAIGGPSDGEAWQLADREPLADPAAVARWLVERSGLPAGILRRLAVEPMILHPIGQEQTERLAVRLCHNLPPSLDGLGVDDFRAALQSPHGWRAVAALIERAWVDGHEDLPLAETDVGTPAGSNPSPVSSAIKPLASRQPTRLGEKLGIPSSRSRLLAKARRLGLRRATDFERLAMARGYFLPGEDTGATVTAKEVARNEFTDSELTAALLSPCLEFSESAICRGAQMLGALPATLNPALFVYEVRRARGEAVLRHVARIGRELDPHRRLWRELLQMLPSALVWPDLPSGVMPDAAIRHIFLVSRP